MRDLVAVLPEIFIFRAFADIVGISSSTTSATSVDDPELNLLGFIGEGEDGDGLCGDVGGLFGVGHHKLL